MESGELVVRYRARRTYSRRTTEATREFPSLSRPCMLLSKTTLRMPPTSLSVPEPVAGPRRDSDTKHLLSCPRGPGADSFLERHV